MAELHALARKSPEPNTALVAMLRDLLASAEAGDLRSLAWAGTENGSIFYDSAAEDRDEPLVVVGLLQCADDLRASFFSAEG